MQDQTYDDYDAEADRPSRFGRIRSAVSTAIGALVAMALLMALGIWFYRLGVRDAQNVPIIRAAMEPEKVRPTDPGGLVAPHQEIESYEVAGSQPTASAAAVVATQPPQPKPEDLPMAALQPAGDQETATPETQTPVVIQPLPSAEGTAQNGEPVQANEAGDTPEAPADGQQLALSDQTLSDPQPDQQQVEVEPDQSTAETEAEPEFPGATKFAPARSPVAAPRPANVEARIVAAVATEQQTQLDLVKAAASSPVQIQLAADPNEQAIRAKWLKIRKANEDLLHNRALAIQTTVSGGTTFYRLRIGPFDSAAEARSVCQALKGRGQDCIVARNS